MPKVDVKHVKKMARDAARPKPSRPLKSRPSVKDERRRVRRELKGGSE